jgi:hypothetical protein
MYLSCNRGYVGQGTFGSLSTIEGIIEVITIKLNEVVGVERS